jgi:hypothetical protein
MMTLSTETSMKVLMQGENSAGEGPTADQPLRQLGICSLNPWPDYCLPSSVGLDLGSHGYLTPAMRGRANTWG